MTQVLSTSSFYNHKWTEFNKPQSNWFDKIRQSESFSSKQNSVFSSLVYSRQTTNLKPQSNETNYCMHATRTLSNKSSKEESIPKVFIPILKTSLTTSPKEASINTPPHRSESSETIVSVNRSPSPNHSSRKSNERVLKNSIFQSPSASPNSEKTFNDISVPSWTVQVFTRRYVIEGTEDLSDHIFLNRHERLELAEKKRKRRDEKCLEEREKLNRLKQALNSSAGNPVFTLKHIEVVEKEPKLAFGRVIPDFKEQCFSLPPHYFMLAKHEKTNLSRHHNSSKSKKK